MPFFLPSKLTKSIFWFYSTLLIILNAGFLTHLPFLTPASSLSVHESRIPLSTHANFLKHTEFSKSHECKRNYKLKNGYNNSSKPGVCQTTLGSCFVNCGIFKLGSANEYRIKPVGLLVEDDQHKMLKDLYLNRDKHFDESLGKNCNLYRYFNITKKNIKDHLNSTMDEYFENRKKNSERPVYMIDGNAFNGDPDWTLPLPREMTSYKIPEVGKDPIVPMGSQESNFTPNFGNEVLESIYKMIPDDDDEKEESDPKKELVELYDEVGDNDYEVFEDQKLYSKEFFQDVKFTSNKETRRDRELLHKVMIQPTAFPSYLDPDNPTLRTGRRREIQKKRDSGRLQRMRWEMDVEYEDDIPRGEWTRGDDITKEFNDSIEWEEVMPTHQDNNYYKRSYYEGGFGDEDRTVDNYFDIQFIGSTDAYPFAVSAGMQFTWPIYWVPWLCKKMPKRRGQPIRSQVFNLGGVEPLQLWFYPEGTAQSDDGYCSLKLVSPPGWNLPYRIYLYVFSEYNRVVLGPMYRESSEYVSQSLNTCRLLDKNDKKLLENPENDKDYVILGPSGNVYVGVGVVDEPIREHKQKFEFKYDWDEGDYEFNQWLKKQTSNPDDEFTMKNIEKERTHSIWYESHKYRHVPDRNISRYWKTRYNEEVSWDPPTF